jgi:hypothetical protein
VRGAENSASNKLLGSWEAGNWMGDREEVETLKIGRNETRTFETGPEKGRN